MRNVIDIENWKRKEEYLFFRAFQSPLVGITTEVDCTIAFKRAKAAGMPVSRYYMHAALVAANRVEEFRYREENGQVVLYDKVDLFTPILTAAENYRSVAIPYHENLNDFLAAAEPLIENAKRGEGCAHSENEHSPDLILISVNPWYRFTGIQLSDPAQPHESFPIFTFGKLTTNGDRLMMPVSLRVSHGFVDGFHIGRFLDEFQRMLDRESEE